MTPKEVEGFLRERQVMTVATIARDGRPHLTAMWYGFLADGSPALWTYGKSQKVVNLRRDARLTCLVEDGEAYNELRGVELQATATILEDRPTVDALGLSVYERYTGPIDDNAHEVVRVMGAKRVAVRIDVERTVSWDHRKQ
ncbi:MAG: TIGR03618 family F420-dependent PPOX class oxidoreductase [Actinobacteria bacterium]|nr:TIGR03618 family F420-dependent PPOX class oxidoreductase [Actinomycetota bacterium]